MNWLDATYLSFHAHPGGADALSLRLGKGQKTLSHELKGGAYKLGVGDWIAGMHFTGDTRPLQAVNAEFGLMCIPLLSLDAVDEDTCAHMAATAKEFAEFAGEVAKRACDGDISDNDMAAFEREWSELVARGTQFLGHLRAMNLAAKPAHLRAVA